MWETVIEANGSDRVCSHAVQKEPVDHNRIEEPMARVAKGSISRMLLHPELSTLLINYLRKTCLNSHKCGISDT